MAKRKRGKDVAGKMCMGNNDVPQDPALSRAYCEGRTAHIASWPGPAQNPHPEGTPAREAWRRGFDSWDSPSGDPSQRDCCAELGNTAP